MNLLLGWLPNTAATNIHHTERGKAAWVVASQPASQRCSAASAGRAGWLAGDVSVVACALG